MLKSLEDLEQPLFSKVSVFLITLNPFSLQPQILLRLHQSRDLYQSFSGEIADEEPSIFFTAARALVRQAFGLITPKHPITTYEALTEHYTNEHQFSLQSADSTAHLMSSETFHEVLLDLMNGFTEGTLDYLIHDTHLTLFYRPPSLINVEALNKFLHFNCAKSELAQWSFHQMPLEELLKPPLKELISGFDRVLLETAMSKFNLSEPTPKPAEYAVFACESEPHMRGMYEALYMGNLMEEGHAWETYRVHQLQFPDSKALARLKGIVVSGSHDACYDEDQPWIVQLKILLVDIYKNYPHVKLVGICFGHQMIAAALGGVACKMPLPLQQPMVYKRENVVLNEDFAALPFVQKVSNRIAPGHVVESLRVIQVHGDHVEEMPPDFQLYASSGTCKVEAYGQEGRVLCFQGHPEFNPFFTYQKLLLVARMKGSITEEFFAMTAKNIVGEEQEALKLDRNLLFRFIGEFLK